MRASLREQVVSVLSADTQLDALLSGAIYHERPPGALSLPVLVYRFVRQEADGELEGGGKYTTQVLLRAYAADLGDAEAIASRAAEVLADSAESGGLDTASERVVRASADASETRFADFADEDQPVFEVSVTCRIVFFDVES